MDKKVWIDLGIGLAASAQETLTSSDTELDSFGEARDYSFKYDWPLGAAIDIGGGVLVSRQLGFGLTISGTGHAGPAELYVRLPHPLFFNRHASDTAPTEEDLTRSEGALHFSAVFVPVQSSGLQIRLFGGPTYFRLEADSVSSYRWVQSYLGTLNSINITTYETEKHESSGIGFHVGADLGVFISPSVGVGVTVRASRGSVDWADGISSDQKISVGGVQAVAGLRFRF